MRRGCLWRCDWKCTKITLYSILFYNPTLSRAPLLLISCSLYIRELGLQGWTVPLLCYSSFQDGMRPLKWEWASQSLQSLETLKVGKSMPSADQKSWYISTKQQIWECLSNNEEIVAQNVPRRSYKEVGACPYREVLKERVSLSRRCGLWGSQPGVTWDHLGQSLTTAGALTLIAIEKQMQI